MNAKLLKWQTQWDKDCIKQYIQDNPQTKDNPKTLSRPFAYGVSEEYLAADFKLMVIGQEAAGFSLYNDPTAWDLPRTQQWVVDYTRRQLFGIRAGDAQEGRTNSSPFWNFQRNLSRLGLTPSWNNVDKVYQKKTDENGEKVIRLTNEQRETFNKAICEGKTLLQREIEISKSDGIVFVTGPHYRISMETALGLPENKLLDKKPTLDSILTDISKECNLAIPCLWTYHPRFLNLKSVDLKACAQKVATIMKQHNK